MSKVDTDYKFLEATIRTQNSPDEAECRVKQSEIMNLFRQISSEQLDRMVELQGISCYVTNAGFLLFAPRWIESVKKNAW